MEREREGEENLQRERQREKGRKTHRERGETSIANKKISGPEKRTQTFQIKFFFLTTKRVKF